MPKLPSLGGPPEQPQEMDCAALNSERTRLLAERADLKSPLLSSNTDAEREAELTQLNGKLYTVEKAQFAKSCPLSRTRRHRRHPRLCSRCTEHA